MVKTPQRPLKSLPRRFQIGLEANGCQPHSIDARLSVNNTFAMERNYSGLVLALSPSIFVTGFTVNVAGLSRKERTAEAAGLSQNGC